MITCIVGMNIETVRLVDIISHKSSLALASVMDLENRWRFEIYGSYRKWCITKLTATKKKRSEVIV